MQGDNNLSAYFQYNRKEVKNPNTLGNVSSIALNSIFIKRQSAVSQSRSLTETAAGVGAAWAHNPKSEKNLPFGHVFVCSNDWSPQHFQ